MHLYFKMVWKKTLCSHRNYFTPEKNPIVELLKYFVVDMDYVVMLPK